MNPEKNRLLYFAKISVANLLLFLVVYLPMNFLAENRERSSLYFDWEQKIPLMDWMIVPYLSMKLLFIYPLLLLKKEEIKNLGLAFATCTIIAGMIFFIFPCEVSFVRKIPDGIFAIYYQNLFLLDKPYNLIPSLHVCYTVLYFFSCIKKIDNVTHIVCFGSWVFLVILSVLFTHQHHIADIAAGIALAWLSYRFWGRKSVTYQHP